MLTENDFQFFGQSLSQVLHASPSGSECVVKDSFLGVLPEGPTALKIIIYYIYILTLV